MEEIIVYSDASRFPRIYYPRCWVRVVALFNDDIQPTEFGCIPLSASVLRNDARHADTAKVELEFKHLPVDPRTVKDMVVAVYMGNANSALGELKENPENRVFVGTVDEPEVSLEEGMRKLLLTCRDYTGIYLDFKWPEYVGTASNPKPSLPTPPGTTLKDVVDRIRLAVTPKSEPAIFSDPASARLDVHRKTQKRLFAPDDADSAWDVLSRVCDLFGLVPVWEQDQLFIRSPSEPGTNTANMAFGYNVEKVSLKRNLKRQKAGVVKVVAWDPVSGESREATYPKIDAAKTKSEGTRIEVVDGAESEVTVEDLAGLPPQSQPALDEVLGLNLPGQSIPGSLPILSRAKALASGARLGEPPPESYNLPLGDGVSANVTTSQKGKVTTKVDVKVVQYSVEGNFSQAELEKLAKEIHFELAQSHLEGEITTRDMDDLYSGVGRLLSPDVAERFGNAIPRNADFLVSSQQSAGQTAPSQAYSLLALKNSDRLVLNISPFFGQDIFSMEPEKAFAILTGRSSQSNGFNVLSDSAARLLIDAWTILEGQAEFYVTSVEHRWSADDGYAATIKFRSFILE